MINLKKVFFENNGVKQTILKNTFWLMVSEGIGKPAKLILIIYVARILGATEYGKFTFALAYIAFFASFSDFGLSPIITRELSGEKEKEKDFSPLFTFKILLGLAVFILILLSSFLITSDPVVRGVIWILGIYTIVSGLSSTIFAFFRARQQMQHEAWGKIIQALTEASIGVFVILNFPSVQNLSYAYLIAGVITFTAIILFFHLKIFKISLSWNNQVWKRFLYMSWPVALVGIFATVYAQTDSIMMGYLGQLTETGWYNASYSLIRMILVSTTIIASSFFPALSYAFKEGKERFQKISDYQIEVLTLLAVPVVVGGIVLAPRIIYWIYGASFSPSILAFQILILMAGITFFSNAFTLILIIANQQKKLLWITLTGALVNVILNFILIPQYSLYGAAIASTISVSLTLALLLRFISKFTSLNILKFKVLQNFIGASLATATMYVIMQHPSIYYLNLFFVILISIISYLFTLFLYRKIINKLKTILSIF